MLVVPNATSDPRHTRCPDKAPHSHICVPIQSRERLLGVIDLYLADPSPVDQLDLALLSSVGRQIGVAVENALLYESLRFYVRLSTSPVFRLALPGVSPRPSGPRSLPSPRTLNPAPQPALQLLRRGLPICQQVGTIPLLTWCRLGLPAPLSSHSWGHVPTLAGIRPLPATMSEATGCH